VAVLAGVAAAAAVAQGTAAYGGARLGSLSVTAGVLVEPTKVDMRGVWDDSQVACTVNRRLGVRADIDFQPISGTARHVTRRGSFLDVNCAEGGPNVGFTISARSAGLACPNGSWMPGRYSFLTRVTEPTRRLQGSASLVWTKPGRCRQ
jgi:hypothetical protein